MPRGRPRKLAAVGAVHPAIMERRAPSRYAISMVHRSGRVYDWVVEQPDEMMTWLKDNLLNALSITIIPRR